MIVLRLAEMNPGRARVDGMEEFQIDAGRDDLDLVCRRVVQIDHLLPVARGGRDDAVGELHDLVLDLEAAVGLTIDLAAGDLVLHGAQRMKHLDDRRALAFLQRAGDPAREPIVRVVNVITDSLIVHHGLDAMRKLRQIIEQPVLAVGFFRPGGDVEDARARTQTADILVRHPRTGGTRKDVDAMPTRGKLA